jgi:hypothetical protein
VLTPLAAVAGYLCAFGATRSCKQVSAGEIGIRFPVFIALGIFMALSYVVWITVSLRYHIRMFLTWRSQNYNIHIVDIGELRQQSLRSTSPSLLSGKTCHRVAFCGEDPAPLSQITINSRATESIESIFAAAAPAVYSTGGPNPANIVDLSSVSVQNQDQPPHRGDLTVIRL